MLRMSPSNSVPRPGKAPVIIAVILSIFALHLGREFFIPIAMALMFHALLRRPVRALEAMRVPAPLGAFLVLLATLGALGVAAWAVAPGVRSWIRKAPQSIANAQERLREFRGPVERIAQAASGDTAGSAAAGRRPQPAPAASSQPTIMSQALGRTTLIVGGFVEVVLLLYLLLGSGDLFFNKLMRVIPQREDKRAAIEILHFAESVVARYLVLMVFIAIGQGAAVGLALWAIGFPDPLIWALLTAVLEMIPYLGAAAMVVLLSLTGLTVYPTVGQALLPPLLYLGVSAIQNNVITPMVFGKRLKLNAVAVLIGVVFWWLVWGIPGAFLAIPILAMGKALADEIPKLKPLSEFLSD